MWKISIVNIYFLVTLLFTITITTLRHVHANQQVPCFYIFGDSLSDAGNNNGLKTKAKANYKPYGLDFPGGRPTGRFTNGLTAVDVIAELLGFKGYIMPFSNANGSEIMKGVNYASGSAGIRRETGQHLGDRLGLDVQLENHKKSITKLGAFLKRSVGNHLRSCLYTINIGSNDYINNYFLPQHYITSKFLDPNQFAQSLIGRYSKSIQALYRYGARKVALFGLGPLGCTLAEVAIHRPNTLCVDSINNAVVLFNQELKNMVDNLNKQLPGAKIILIDTEAIHIGPFQGLTILNESCCKLREDFQCKESTIPCHNRKVHAFWDGFHPTEAVNRIVGGRAYKSKYPNETHPYDISTLVKLKLN